MDFTIPADAELALRLGVFLAMFAALALWEAAAPARAPRLSRRVRWRANLGLAALNVLVLRVALPGSALAFAALAAEEGWGLLNRITMPGWTAVLLGAVLLDLVIYFQHVLFHSVPALARLHAVHHADPDFDLTTGIRFHPLEIVLSTLIKLAAIAALGAPVLAVLVFELLLNASAMFNHANVSLPGWLEPRVRRVLVTPDMHRTHHSVIETERNSNYGFCLSVWDRWLGTYTPAPRGELDIGLPAWRDPGSIATLGGVLRMPFASQPHEIPVHPQ
jgi:sterol desaturase/sphingolipid hydroxylase (fatty acid hydroxylase superfamily)